MRTAIYRHPHPKSTGETDLATHTGQTVDILRPLTPDEADEECGPMFKVRFEDGFEANVFEDELEGDI